MHFCSFREWDSLFMLFENYSANGGGLAPGAHKGHCAGVIPFAGVFGVNTKYKALAKINASVLPLFHASRPFFASAEQF